MLAERAGLLLPGCSGIHMFGMRYPLDIIYLDRDGKILKVVAELQPWQISGCLQAAAVLEVGSGTAARQGWQAGVRLEHLGYDAHKHAVEIKIEQRTKKRTKKSGSHAIRSLCFLRLLTRL